MSDVDPRRERSLELLRTAHQFPGLYTFRIVVHPEHEDATLDAMRAALGRVDAIGAVRRRESRTGRFLALRTTVMVVCAEEVLDLYAALKAVQGVITVF